MKRVIFIGQAMPRVKKHPHDWPSLNTWLYSIGLSDKEIQENFFYSALVDYFPGLKGKSHRVPTKQEVEKERSRLQRTLKEFGPDIIVPIGKLSISYCLQDEKSLKECVGLTFLINPYNLIDKEILIIPFPHPSGASIWYKKAENKKLLTKALELLKENL